MIQVKTTKGRFPLILLVSILFVTLALLLGLLWQVWFAYKYSRRIQTHNLQIQRLTGTIIYLDEVLTMSARMGATTGEQKWEERYLIYEHQLDTDINEAKRLISDAFLIESAAQTDNANIKLVAMEKRAFDLIREGKKDAAITLLFSETYEVQKKIYADGMEQITAEMQMSGKRFLDGYYYRISLAVIAVAIILPCLMIAWVYVLRAMNMNIRARKLVEEKIMLLNESLEQRVSKRTADLAKTNEKLELEIIKRTKTEEKLKDSFEQTRVWLDNSPVCTKVVDLDFNLKYMSDAGVKALKIDDVTTLYGKPYPFDFFPESTKKVMQKTLKKVKETGETITGEAPVCDIEGNEAWFQATFVPVKDVEGRIDFIIVVSVDINERKKFEERIVDVAHILEDSLNEIYIFDAKTLRFIQVNKGARLNLGYSMEELSVLTPLDLKPEVTAESFAKIIEPLRIGEKHIIEFTEVHRRKDGSLYDVEVHLQLSTFQSAPVFVAIILDVTKRKKAESERDRFFNKSIDMLCIAGFDGYFKQLNSGWTSTLGWRIDELLSRPWLHFVHPDDHQSTIEMGEKLQYGKSVVDFENRYQCIDGTYRWISWNSFPILEEKQIFAVARDITERKSIERELKELNESLENRVIERSADLAKLSLAVEQSSSTIVITDVKGTIEYVNPNFTQTTGYTREEAMGKNPSILKSGLQKSDFYEEMWCTLLSGNKWQGEFHNKRKSGGFYWELAAISPVKNNEGVITNYVAIKEDITKHKQLEAELLQRADLIKLLQEITIDANEAASLEEAMHICLYRICSFSNWPIGHVYMVGSDGMLEPTTIWELRDVKKYHEFQKFTENTAFNICKGLPGRVLADSKAHWIINVTKDDNFPRMKVAADVGLKGAFAFPVLEGERVVAVLEFFSNTAEQPDPFILKIITQLGTHLGRITERKQTEVKIKEAMKEAIQANKAKSVFLSSMSHELRTPMNSVLGFAQLLDSDSNETLSKSQKDNVKQILKSGYHLLELINEILDLSGIESGMVRVSSENIEIDTAINDAITSVEPIAQENSIKINYPIKYSGQYIRADSTRLNQVLINLLSNAIKYNNVDGSVTISCESPDADTIRINIEDTGPGIAEENHDSLFKPFNRLGAESLNIEGSGVGLSITKRLVEMMGGSIKVESEVGKGSKFYVDFKKVESSVLTTGKNEEVVAEKNKAEITKKYTLLYVEDNPSNLRLVENILQRRPSISLLTAPQAQSGIELAHAHNPDMILMDINLPGMDGYEAFKLLKSHDQTKEIPVIALSANAMPKDIERGKAVGFRDYITKPIDVKRFLEVVERVLAFPHHL